MRVIAPIDVTFASSDAPGSPYPLWSSVTTYAVNDRVHLDSTSPPSEWQSIQAGSNKPPETNPEYWVRFGVTNPYKILDATSTTQTTATTSLTMTVTTSRRCTHLALFNLDNVRSVTATVNYNGTPEWSGTVTLGRTDISGTWWEFFFAPGEYGDSIILPIPAYHNDNQTITILIEGDTGATIAAGNLMLGLGQELGLTLYEADIGVQSYSRKEADQWGNYVLTPRANSKRLQARVLLPRGTVDRAYRLLASLDARAAVWDLNNSDDPDNIEDSLRVYGFYRDFRVLMSGYNQDFCELEIEGLV